MDNIVEVEILNDPDSDDLSRDGSINYCDDDGNFFAFKKARQSLGNLDPQDTLLGDKISVPETPDGITAPFDGNKFYVEDIVDFSDSGTNKDKYLVKWKGWDSSYNTWEPLENLNNCLDSVTAFYEKRKIEWQLVLKNSEYVTMSDGKKRRRGPRLAVPPDHRPLSEIITEFNQLQTKSLKAAEETEAELEYFKALRQNKTLLWDERKMKKYLGKCLDGDFNEQINTDLQIQIFYLHLIERRKQTLRELGNWEGRLNGITRGKPRIIIENEADLATSPKDFIYSNAYVPGEGVVIPDDPPLGCSCTENGDCWTNKKKCCPSGFGAENGYTKRRRVKEGVGIPLYECNKACKCDRRCPNRVVQDGYSTLEGSIMKIFRTFNGCGWGVKTVKAISKGMFVGLYIGEVITTDEAERRGKEYDVDGRSYLFDLDFNSDSNPFTVDAKTFGNFTHFINHSCDANLGVYSVWVNCLDPNLPMLALFSLRDISEGEEITINYSNELDTRKRKNEFGRQICLCGTKKCRGYIF